MSNFIQIVYASRVTFEVQDGLNREVLRILMEARNKNPQKDIGGVLYYADGCFFQCLEGKKDIVLDLFEEIRKDSRHTQIQILVDRSISKRLFRAWSMKFVPVHEQVTDLLKEKGFATFDPYKFNIMMIDEILRILSNADDPTGDAGKMPPNGLFSRFINKWKKP